MGGRGGKEGGRERGGMEGRDGALSCDYCNHLYGDTPSTHCKQYTQQTNFPLTLLYSRYTTCTECHYFLPPASLHPFPPFLRLTNIYEGKYTKCNKFDKLRGPVTRMTCSMRPIYRDGTSKNTEASEYCDDAEVGFCIMTHMILLECQVPVHRLSFHHPY